MLCLVLSFIYTPFLFFLFRFSVNRRIFVVGFGLYGSIHGPTDYQVNIQVWVRAVTRVVRLFEARFGSYFVSAGWGGSGTDLIYAVVADHPH